MRNHDQIDATDALEAIEQRYRPRLVSNLLLWLILGFFLLFLIWASLTKLDRTVRGIGRIIPNSQLQIISNPEGGIVEEILVKTGQTVRAGQALVRLDPTASSAELGSGEASIIALAAKVERLKAEVTGRSPGFPAATDPSAMGQVEIERALYASRMSELNAIAGAARARVISASRAVAEAQSMLASRQSAANAARAELDAIRPLVDQGIEPRLSLSRAMGAATSASSEAAAASAAVARAQAGVAEANAALAQQTQDWRSRSAGELAAAQAELSARRASLPALRERADRAIVSAPVDGRINRVIASSIGGTVAPGSPIVELVPTGGGLIVEAMVSPKDIASVKVGQRAKVDVSAYDNAVFGSLEGKVIAVSPDAIVNERTGESHFLVRVQTAGNSLKGPSGRALPIGAGMTANVSLLGNRRSVLSYILTPITRLQEDAFRE